MFGGFSKFLQPAAPPTTLVQNLLVSARSRDVNARYYYAIVEYAGTDAQHESIVTGTSG